MNPPERPNLRATVSASAGELRQFMALLKGKSPAEAMGIVAQSHLLRAILMAAGIQVAIILIFTFTAYLRPARQPAAQAPPPAAASVEPARAPAAAPATRPAADIVPSASRPATSKPPKGRDIEDLLDIK